LVGCADNFLTKTPPDEVPAEGYFDSPEAAAEAVNATYAALQSNDLWAEELMKMLDFPSDDERGENTWGVEMNSFAHSPSDEVIFDVYSGAYRGIQRANTVLQEVPNIDMDQDRQQRYVAEAKFVRSLLYWLLTTTYGEVPLITETFEDPSDVHVPKSSIDEIYGVITSDLQDAASVLPPKDGGSDPGRATRGAARALLGKIYLYDENYSQAAEWLRRVIDSGQYRLVDDFETIINRNHENDDEAVFELQFLQDGFSDLQTQRVAYNLPQGGGGVGNHLPVQDLVDEFEDGDPRLDYTVFREGQPYAPHLDDPEMEMYNPTWSATDYNIKKGMVPIKLTQNGGTNWPIIRYADVLLMYAEAVNFKENREPQEAIDAINEVRSRPSVDMPTYPDNSAPYSVSASSSEEEIFEAIVHERRVELALEGHRFADLRRWGLAEEELDENGYTEPKHRYMPLPQEEVDVNPELEQREGW